MSTLRIRLPESLHKRAKAYAAQEGISVNPLIAAALAEKLTVAGVNHLGRWGRGSFGVGC